MKKRLYLRNVVKRIVVSLAVGLVFVSCNKSDEKNIIILPFS